MQKFFLLTVLVLKATADAKKASIEELNKLFVLDKDIELSVWSSPAAKDTGFYFLNFSDFKIVFTKDVEFVNGEATVSTDFTASIAAENSFLTAVKAKETDKSPAVADAFKWKVGENDIEEIASKEGKEIKLESFKLTAKVDGEKAEVTKISEMKFKVDLTAFGADKAIEFTINDPIDKKDFKTAFIGKFGDALGNELKNKDIDLEKINAIFKDVKVKLDQGPVGLALTTDNTWNKLKTNLGVSSAGSGMAWWMWILIALAVVLVIGIIVFFVLKSKNNK